MQKVKEKKKLSKENITRLKETLKQRMQLKTQEMQRYEKRGKSCYQNLFF